MLADDSSLGSVSDLTDLDDDDEEDAESLSNAENLLDTGFCHVFPVKRW